LPEAAERILTNPDVTNDLRRVWRQEIGVCIKLSLKQFSVRILLDFLRGLILLKRHGGPLLRKISAPILTAGHFLVQFFGVPLYRFAFWIKRQTSSVVLPAKHRILYLVSNRYAIHFAVVAIAAMTSMVNLGGSEVRAESFGQKSMLYALVSNETSATVEVVEASGNLVVPQASSYMGGIVVDASAHVDFNYLDEAYVTTTVGGSSVSSPTIRENGQSIAPRTKVEAYVVQEGDVLGSISEKFGLSLSSLLWANDLTYRSTIRPGQELMIPPVDGVIYTVKNGDTLSKIASKYSSDESKIIAFNALASGDDLVIGEEIILPNGEPPAPPVVRTAPVAAIFTAPSSSSDNSGQTKKGSAAGSGSWVWPTNWRVITQYYGWRHTGVDIDGDYGTQSVASCSGTVIYSGWKGGYGNTVEVQCDDPQYVLRYGHHAKNYVGVGTYVTAGQAIAQTGTTGRSTGTHLHFEVIKNGRFQNPLDYVR